MNYFAHGRRFTGFPYFVAGAALPDWLNVVDRRAKARARLAAARVNDANPLTAAVARGVMQHHHDDEWFHQSRAFAELNLAFTVLIREALPAGDDSFRPSFLGHILVELLLDDVLSTETPGGLDAYYAALRALDPPALAAAIEPLLTRPVIGFDVLITRFSAERFLYDYASDAKLLYRLNQVMKRVKLPQLPASLSSLFPTLRDQVQQRRYELLAGENPPLYSPLQ